MDMEKLRKQQRSAMRRLLAEYDVEHMLHEVTDCPSAVSVHVAQQMINWAVDAGAGPAGIAAVLREKPASAARAAQLVAEAEGAEPHVPDVPADPPEDPDGTAGNASAPAQPDGAPHPDGGQYDGAASVQRSWASAFAAVGGPVTGRPIGAAMRAGAQPQPSDKTGAGGGVTAEPPAVNEAPDAGWSNAFASVTQPGARPFPSPSIADADQPQPGAQAAAADGGAVAANRDAPHPHSDAWADAFARAGG